MSTEIPEGLLGRYIEHVAPFVRHDDFYGNILIPSPIGNQKGRFRPIINRRPFYLYKDVALSSPEVRLSLKRAEVDILNPLAISILEYDFHELGLLTIPVIEAIFRFLIICGNDQDAVNLVLNLAENGFATKFLLRSVGLLCEVNQNVKSGMILNDSILNFEPKRFLNWLSQGQENDYQLAGESEIHSKLYFRNFQYQYQLDFLKSTVGDLDLAIQRPSAQKWLSYTFQSLCSSGQLFIAFKLGWYFVKQPLSLGKYFFEELLLISLANDRIRLYLKIKKKQKNSTEPTEQFRLSLFGSLYGEVKVKLAQKLLSVNQIAEFVNILPAPEIYRRDSIEEFEELMLIDELPEWFLLSRRYLANYAGDDFRIRGLLATYYSRTDKARAIDLLRTVSRPLILVYTLLRISQNQLNRKSIDYLRKMLEPSSND
ncbi:MAG: hypothetical protein H3C43_07670 [Leptonema sp. (in: Bacteria)]|nr:hypothetical protein [Leptonema sp. (in: bacteria)]